MTLESSKKSYFVGSIGLLENVGKVRDGLLILGAALYGLGYLVWSNYALQNNLGLLPALDAQYFLAGVVPGLLIAFTFFTIKAVTSIPIHIRTYFQSHRFLLFLFPLLPVAFLLSVEFGWWKIPTQQILGVPIIILAPISFSLALPYYFAIALDYAKSGGFSRIYNLYFLPIYGCLVAMFFYTSSVYPNLPPEFGGVHPRSAYIDFERQKVSYETLKDLLDSTQVRSNTGVVRSCKLVVLYTGNNFLLVKPALDSTRRQICELNRSTILSIYWLR
jgi:hypothetical protein